MTQPNHTTSSTSSYDDFDYPLHSWKQVVRFMARRWPPHLLTKQTVHAAERDPELAFDNDRGVFVRVRNDDDRRHDRRGRQTKGRGVSKVRDATSSIPAAAREETANTHFQGGDHD